MKPSGEKHFCIHLCQCLLRKKTCIKLADMNIHFRFLWPKTICQECPVLLRWKSRSTIYYCNFKFFFFTDRTIQQSLLTSVMFLMLGLFQMKPHLPRILGAISHVLGTEQVKPGMFILCLLDFDKILINLPRIPAMVHFRQQ